MTAFCDEITLKIISGHGGNGAISFRREKYAPKGGPDGGDGGWGGNIFLKVNTNLNTLSKLRNKKLYKARNGENGSGNDRHGANGEDLFIEIPDGTLVYEIINNEKRLLIDMSHGNNEYAIAKGGRGGYGNAHFISSIRQAPSFAELGDIGEEKELVLELKLVADVGIIGLPSSGKSTLISVISNARPKIADYDFTTIIPNLGMVEHHDYSFVVSDIPGLIEGASSGKGLGFQFLKHIERCEILIHLLDITKLDDIVKNYNIVQNELKKYSKVLFDKNQIIVINKIDTLEPELTNLIRDQFVKETKLKKNEIFLISAVSHKGLEELMDYLTKFVKDHKSTKKEIEDNEEEYIVIKPLETDPERWWIERDENNKIHVKGKRIEQIIRMSDTKNAQALERIIDILHKKGIDTVLTKEGLLEGDEYYIAGKRFEYEEKL